MGLKRIEFSRAITPKANLKKLQGLSITPGGNPQFPGKGNLFPASESIDSIRDFIKNQKRCKGFLFNVPSGTSNFQIQISGEAKLMLGLSMVSIDNLNDPAAQPTQIELTVNNEIIIDQLHPVHISPDFMDEEYYLFLRPLSGQDDINISFENPNANQNMSLAIYYL